jgi:Flp pilus assembly protein TadD
MPRKSGTLCLTASFALLVVPVEPAHGADARWIRLKSANFEVYSSATVRNSRDTAREFEQVRGLLLQAFGGRPPLTAPVRLVVFGSAKEYQPYRLNEFATAYYHQTADRDYIVMSRTGADTFPVAVHEYLHLLVRHSGLQFPPWLNEGLAELYSTLRPVGDKILVGDLIPARYRALLEEEWVPLNTILSADRSSPYYNEKNRAGRLYNEGWALTHMLYFRAEYRPKFGELLRRISGGEESAQALEQVYGRPVAQIEKDLQRYLRGRSFQGVLVAAKLEKASEEIPVEPLADFDVRLMLADLLGRPGTEGQQQAELEQLARTDPKRPEPYRELGYLEWRAGRREEAVRQFGKAFDCGDRGATLLWDYGRLLEAAHGEDAIRVLSELLNQDPDRIDVRLELAEAQLRANQPKAALATAGSIRTIAPADTRRFYRVAVYAYVNSGDRRSALQAARHFRDLAKTDEDRAAADLLIRQAGLP